MTSFTWPPQGSGSGSDFVNSVSNTSSINLTVTLGVLSAEIAPGGIVNSMVNANAGIEMTKLEVLTASRVPVLNASGFLTASGVTATTLTYLDATSSIQTQLNGKQASGNYITALTTDVVASGPGSVVATIQPNVVTDAKLRQSAALSVIGRSADSVGDVADISAGTDHFVLRRSGTALGFGLLVDANIASNAAIALNKLAALTASRALVSDGSGVVSVSTTTSTQIGYLSTTTSDVQTQLNAKQETITGAATTIVSSDLTIDRSLISNGSGKVAVSATTSTEIGYVSGVTSAIQTQLDAKQTRSDLTTKGDIYVATASNTTTRQGAGTNHYVLRANSGVTNGIEYALPQNSSRTVLNLGINGNAASNTMIISIKTSAGADASSTDPIFVGFRDATLATGNFSVVSITGALSTTISNGSTLGQLANVASRIYVYLINNAGTAEIAYSRIYYGDSGIISTTAEGGAGGADSNYVMYSTTARSNVAYLAVGYIISSQSSPGVWVNGPTTTQLQPFNVEKIYAYYDEADPQTITNGGTLILGDRVKDVYNIYNPSTGVATIPKTTSYLVASVIQADNVVAAVGNIYGIVLNKAGSETRTWIGHTHTYQTTSSVPAYTSFSAVVECVQGDTLTFTFTENVTNAMTTSNSPNRTYIMIQEQ